MPELPDVHVFKQYLDATALHKTIEELELRDGKILGRASAQQIHDTLKGNRFESARRHGKYLLVALKDSGWLVLHFGMTGFLRYFKGEEEDKKHNLLLVSFANGYRLAYNCRRKLGTVDLAESAEAFIEAEKLGPDTLELDFDAFQKLFEGRRGSVKSLLMNQSAIAGLGNIYTDEILFQTGIHPETEVGALSEKDRRRLFETLHAVVDQAVACKADPTCFPKGFLTPHRDQDQRCPRCETELEQTKVSGRTTYYCPNCQPPSS